MRVLVACEFSGVVRRAFRERGHDAWSCDILPPEDGDWAHHLKGDVLDVLGDGNWDLMVAHPPCTRLCNSGVHWLHRRNLWPELEEARQFFYALWKADIPKICVENPIPHGHAKLPPYTQIIQPWQFGHGETKATCLWLKGLPPLKPTRIVKGRANRNFMTPKGPDRGRLRSVTYRGIARAMAKQWG